DPWQQLRDAVRKADAVHADETSWRLQGTTSWLWVAASALMACYRIDPSRSQQAAKQLLGEDFGSFVISDRYAGYHWLDVLQQQLCWAHASRQFVELSERPGQPGKLGRKLLDAARQVIGRHRAYLHHGHDLAWLEHELRPLRGQIQRLLEQGTRGRDPKTRRFCAGLLDEYAALWTFCEVPGIDPTNYPEVRVMPRSEAERRSRWAVWLAKLGIIRALRGRRGACRAVGSGRVGCAVGRCGPALVA
ncbi:MAG TPA: transposase, partial [Candidatus Limnocylindrales bacterium]|nr:transposase [Candidatus Limnocylindrales bacterium]